MRRAALPLFSVENHLAAGSFDVLAFNLSAELVYTNVLNLIDLAGLPLHAADRTASDPLVVAGGHCAFNPEPLADFVDAFVLGDGEEVVGEINDVLGRLARRGPRPRRPGDRAPGCAGDAGQRGRGLRPGPVRAPLRGRPAGRHHPDPTGRAGRGREAHRGRPGRLALPPPPAGPVDRGRPRPAQRRGLPGLHPGLPVLSGRHDHPPGARAPGRAGPGDGARRARVERLRRGGVDLALHRRLLGHRVDGARHHRRPPPRRAGVGQPAEPAGGRLHRRHGGPDPAGPAHRPHLRPRGWDVADAPGHQQAHPRGGPLPGGRRRLQPGLAPGEALLPHRAADGDRRGRPRHRRARPSLRRGRPALTSGG